MMVGKGSMLRMLILFVLPGLVSACYYFQKTKTPIDAIWYSQDVDRSRQAENLFILLPGLGDTAEAFEERGLIKFTQEPGFQQGFLSDSVAVNAHFKYYTTKMLIDRLKEDIIEPAKLKGYKKIHLLGISLGGFGALLYLRDHPDDIASVTLLAPYLGEEEYWHHLLNEYVRLPENTEEKNIWPWLETLSINERSKIFLGYGEQDKFSLPNSLLASLLDSGQAVTIAGKHRWTTWQQLWPDLLIGVKESVKRNSR